MARDDNKDQPMAVSDANTEANVSGSAKDDKAVTDAIDKATNATASNCGSCGLKCASCKNALDTKIKEMPIDQFRVRLRGLNACCAILLLFTVLLGLLMLGVDSYSSFVLSIMLLIAGIILFTLEMPCCCKEGESWLRRRMKFLYFARGRAYIFIVCAFLAFGMGWAAILIGLFCLLPYGVFSRYCIAIHPACGDRLVTTQSEEETNAISARGISVYDHYVIIDIQQEAEEMTKQGVIELLSEVQQMKDNGVGQDSAPEPVSSAAPVGAPVTADSTVTASPDNTSTAGVAPLGDDQGNAVSQLEDADQSNAPGRPGAQGDLDTPVPQIGQPH